MREGTEPLSGEELGLTDVQDRTESTQEQAEEALQRFADGFSSPPRSPVLHSPSEHGLEYEDITFLAHDGVPLEAWFIPAPGSSKLIIANHPLGFSRSGIPTHLQPWHAAWAPSGNGFEVDLVPDYIQDERRDHRRWPLLLRSLDRAPYLDLQFFRAL